MPRIVDKETQKEKLIRIDVKTCYIEKAVTGHTTELRNLRTDLSKWQKGMEDKVSTNVTDLAVHKTKYSTDKKWISGIFLAIAAAVGAILKKLFLSS